MEPRDIFISYVQEDGDTARALARELRSLGCSTWSYEEDGIGGVSYLEQIHAAITSCQIFVLVASARSVRAHQVVREVEQAHEQEKVIVPIRVELSHEQFIAANPILRMATGTAVSLSTQGADLRHIAGQVASTVAYTKARASNTSSMLAAAADAGAGPATGIPRTVSPDLTDRSRSLRQPSTRVWIAAGVVAATLAVAAVIIGLPWRNGTDNTPEPPPARFWHVDLSGHLNNFDKGFVDKPVGLKVFDGIELQVLDGVAATGTQGRQGWPSEFEFPVTSPPPRRFTRAHLLLSASWAHLETGPSGTVNAVYESGSDTVVELIDGVNIQEGWKYDRDIFAAPPRQPSTGWKWRTVYQEAQQRGADPVKDKAWALLDLLSVDLDPNRALKSIRLVDQRRLSGVFVHAITLER